MIVGIERDRAASPRTEEGKLIITWRFEIRNSSFLLFVSHSHSYDRRDRAGIERHRREPKTENRKLKTENPCLALALTLALIDAGKRSL